MLSGNVLLLRQSPFKQVDSQGFTTSLILPRPPKSLRPSSNAKKKKKCIQSTRERFQSLNSAFVPPKSKSKMSPWDLRQTLSYGFSNRKLYTFNTQWHRVNIPIANKRSRKIIRKDSTKAKPKPERANLNPVAPKQRKQPPGHVVSGCKRQCSWAALSLWPRQLHTTWTL